MLIMQSEKFPFQWASFVFCCELDWRKKHKQIGLPLICWHELRRNCDKKIKSYFPCVWWHFGHLKPSGKVGMPLHIATGIQVQTQPMGYPGIEQKEWPYSTGYPPLCITMPPSRTGERECGWSNTTCFPKSLITLLLQQPCTCSICPHPLNGRTAIAGIDTIFSLHFSDQFQTGGPCLFLYDRGAWGVNEHVGSWAYGRNALSHSCSSAFQYFMTSAVKWLDFTSALQTRFIKQTYKDTEQIREKTWESQQEAEQFSEKGKERKGKQGICKCVISASY